MLHTYFVSSVVAVSMGAEDGCALIHFSSPSVSDSASRLHPLELRLDVRVPSFSSGRAKGQGP